MLAAFITTLLFSISIVCGHRSAKLIGGTEANFWRLTCAFVLLGIWSYGFGVGLGGSAFPLFLFSGIMGIGVGDVALFQTLPRIGSRLSVLIIQCLGAPCAALIEWLWLGTPLTSVQIVCGLTILAGVGLALSPGKHLNITRRQLIIGSLFALLAAFGGAFGAVLSRKAYAVTHANGESISGANSAFQRILGGLFIAAICLVVVKRNWIRKSSLETEVAALQGVKQKWIRVWPWVLANGVAGQTLGVSFMQRAFETTPTGLVLSIIATTPIAVIPLAWLFEGERPTKRSVLGGVIAVIGVVLLVRFR